MAMLSIKAQSLGKMGDPVGMCEINEKLLELNPDDPGTVANQVEALVLAKKFPAFQKLYEEKKEILEKYKPGLGVFLASMAALMEDKIENAKALLVPYLTSCVASQAPRLGPWEYD